MKRVAVLGVQETAESDLPDLGPLVTTEATVRAAEGALDNPIQRMQERLFWFHHPAHLNHEDRRQGDAAPVPLSVAEVAHDHALRRLIAAYRNEPASSGAIVSGLRAWQSFVSQEPYWVALPHIENRGKFEPQAVASEIDWLRGQAVALAAEPFEIAARDAWARKDIPALRPYLTAFKELVEAGTLAKDCRQNLVSPIVDQLADACQTLVDKYSAKIVRRDDAAERNQPLCAGELQYYRQFVEPAWKNVAAALTENDTEVSLARGDAADCLSTVVLDQTWADQRLLAEGLAAEAIRLATGTIVEARIRDKLGFLIDSAQRATESAISTLRSALADFNSRFSEAGFSKKSQPLCLEALNLYRSSMEPALQALLACPSIEQGEWMVWREQTAVSLWKIATGFFNADEMGTAETLAEEALALAHGSETVTRMQDELQTRRRHTVVPEVCRREDALTQSAQELVRHHCCVIATKFSRNIITAEGFAQRNRTVCREEVLYFRANVEPALRQVVQRTAADHPLLLRLREEVAFCLASIATDHTWADDFLAAERIMEEALRLVSGTPAAGAIQERHARMRKSPADQSQILPVSHSPLVQDKTESETYRFLGTLPPRRERWRLGMALALVASLIITILLVVPYTPPVISKSNQSVSPAQAKPINGAPINNADLSSATTSIPSAETTDQLRDQLNSLRTQIHRGQEQAKTLEGQMMLLYQETQSAQGRNAAGSQEARSWYDYKVDAYQRVVRRRESVISAVNVSVQRYNALLDQHRMLPEYQPIGVIHP